MVGYFIYCVNPEHCTRENEKKMKIKINCLHINEIDIVYIGIVYTSRKQLITNFIRYSALPEFG